MKERPPIQNRIISHAFQHNCSLDKATLYILRQIVNETTIRRTEEGLYAELFETREDREPQEQ